MQRTFLLGLGFALGTVLAASGVQASSISLDDIRRGDTFVSGNGKLEFSDFDFDSSDHVDEDDIYLEVLDDGVRLSGPEGVRDDGKRSFEVSYTVRALDPTMPISGATLELESIVSGDPFAGVVATKKLFASKRDSDHGSDWSDARSRWHKSSKSKSRDDDRWDDDDRKRHSRSRGKGRDWDDDDRKGHEKDRGKGHEKSRGKGHSKHGDDDDDDDDRDRPDREDALAILGAYDIDFGKGCHSDWEDCSLEGQKLIDEIVFDEALGEIRVVDGVKMFSWGDGEAKWVSSANRFPVVPEPSSAGLLGIGLLALAASRRRSATRE